MLTHVANSQKPSTTILSSHDSSHRSTLLWLVVHHSRVFKKASSCWVKSKGESCPATAPIVRALLRLPQPGSRRQGCRKSRGLFPASWAGWRIGHEEPRWWRRVAWGRCKDCRSITPTPNDPAVLSNLCRSLLDMPSTHNKDDKPWDTDDVDKWKVLSRPSFQVRMIYRWDYFTRLTPSPPPTMWLVPLLKSLPLVSAQQQLNS